MKEIKFKEGDRVRVIKDFEVDRFIFRKDQIGTIDSKTSYEDSNWCNNYEWISVHFPGKCPDGLGFVDNVKDWNINKLELVPKYNWIKL